MKKLLGLALAALLAMPAHATTFSTIDTTIPKASYRSLTGTCPSDYTLKNGYCKWNLDPDPIRNNFLAAATDINALYALIGSGGSGSSTPGGSTGQLQFNNNGALGGFTLGGDATINTGTGALTVTKTAGVNFAASATTDATNASNITSGTLGIPAGGTGANDSLTALTNLLTGDNAPKVLGACYLFLYDPLFLTKNEQAQGISYQGWLLDCYNKAVKLGAAAYGDLNRNACIEAIDTPLGLFGLPLNTPIVVPRYICHRPQGQFVRDGQLGVGTDWNTSTSLLNWNGDPTTAALKNPYMPFWIYPYESSITGELRTILNRIGTDRGSGVFYGRSWQIAQLTLQAGGSGLLSGGSGTISCTVANGDIRSPSRGATFTLTVTGGVGTSLSFAGTTRWASQSGVYQFPPYIMRQIWPVNSGDPTTSWDGHDAAHPQVFDNDTNKYFKTKCNGVDYGVTVSAKWHSDFMKNGVTPDSDTVAGYGDDWRYFGDFSDPTAGTGFINRVWAQQSGISTSPIYGPTRAFVSAGFDTEINGVQASGSAVDLTFIGADVRVMEANSVNAGTCLKMESGGSQYIAMAVLDSCRKNYAEIDKVGNYAVDMHLLNTQIPPTGTANIVMGGDLIVNQIGFSDATHTNRTGYLHITAENTGRATPMPLISCQYTRNTIFEFSIGNTALDGNAYATQLYPADLGTGCDKSNVFRGRVDRLAGPALTGTDPGVGSDIYDDSLGGTRGQWGMYDMSGTVAPTNAVTGANKADVGSVYRNRSTGAIYVNTGSISSPTWSQLGGGSLFSSLLGVDLNTQALRTPLTGAVVQVANTNTTVTRIEADAYGAAAYFTAAAYGGTGASPTALTSGTEIGAFNFAGYDGSNLVGPRASFRAYANQNWSGGANGSYAEVATTPNGSATQAAVVRFENNGGITVPPTVTGGNMGAGTINAQGIYVNGGPLPIAQGGTNAITAAAARRSLMPLRVISSGTSDTAASSDYIIKWNSSASGSKAQIIPACNSTLGAGATIIVIDGYGNAGAASIMVSTAGGTIQKGSGAFALSAPFGSATFVCDGSSDWSVM